MPREANTPVVTGPLDALIGLSLALGEAKRALESAEAALSGRRGAAILEAAHRRSAVFWIALANRYLPSLDEMASQAAEEARNE